MKEMIEDAVEEREKEAEKGESVEEEPTLEEVE